MLELTNISMVMILPMILPRCLETLQWSRVVMLGQFTSMFWYLPYLFFLLIYWISVVRITEVILSVCIQVTKTIVTRVSFRILYLEKFTVCEKDVIPKTSFGQIWNWPWKLNWNKKVFQGLYQRNFGFPCKLNFSSFDEFSVQL